ncbi:MAG: hypothetical protein KatS3mg114_1288 [Planctomycetaceae bacterium]|nr:MAG: hypothetical protein KatS3mg114_1288 [Planctomycetaceae bacterium]
MDTLGARWLLLVMVLTAGEVTWGQATAQPSPAAQRVLLVGQLPDGHPPGTHEFVAGLNVLQHLLRKQPRLQVQLVLADEPWEDGPTLISGADVVVLYLAEGARWLRAQPSRQQAFLEVSTRGGGLVCLHWAMGTKPAEHIADFVHLFGGCHGGDDRKYQVLTTDLRPAPSAAEHPILRGVTPFRLDDEYYYQLKWYPREPAPQPLLEAWIDGAWWPVAWSWERPQGGRSFGFSGLHRYENWHRPEVRRLLVQAILWTLHREVPLTGLAEEFLKARGEP